MAATGRASKSYEEHSVKKSNLGMPAQATAVKFVKQRIVRKTIKGTEGNWGALNTQQ